MRFAACFFAVVAAACPAPAPPPVTVVPPPTTPPTTTNPAPPPAKPALSITFGVPKIQGSVDIDDVVHVVHANGPALASCAPVGTNGALSVKMTLKGDGSVGNAVKDSGDVGDAVAGCVVSAVKQWRFAKPKGGLAQLTQPFTFATR